MMPYVSWSILELFVKFLVDQSLAVSTLLVDVIVQPLPIPFLVIHPPTHHYTVPLMLVHHCALPMSFLFHQFPLQIVADIIVILLSLVF